MLQKIVVVTDDWDAVQGTLSCYERTSISSPWQLCLGPLNAVVGKNGLGWGRGLHKSHFDGPVKREGDGKGPAGVFHLRACFGLQGIHPCKMDYIALTPTVEAVDDVNSRYYNEIVDRSLITQPDWKSSEMMAEIKLYRYGVVVDHNYPNPVAGAGSAIFMHTWSNARNGTAGCTGMASEHILQICQWLDKPKCPYLIQCPRNYLNSVGQETTGLHSP